MTSSGGSKATKFPVVQNLSATKLPSVTKLAQIQEAIRQLPPAEQQELRHWFLDEESPALLAAVDEGMRSLAEEPTIPVTELRRKIGEWAAR